MRLTLYLTPSTESVPFDHQHVLMGVLHRWLGPDNPYHDDTSFYGFGMLRGGRVQRGRLTFPEGARWDVGFYEEDGAQRLTAGVLSRPEVASGMRVHHIAPAPEPAFTNPHRFRAAAPILVRRRVDGRRRYLLWDDPEADAVLTDTFRRRLAAAGLTGRDLEAMVRFDRSYAGARSKLVRIRRAAHRGSLCPVWLYGTPA
ncbi:MAG: CRISPR-associated protein Cas6, partial [Bacteroidetes bacterium]